MDANARRVATRVKAEIEAEFAGVQAIVDAKVKDPSEDDFYLWLDGTDAEPDEYKDAWELAQRLADKHWESDDIHFIVKKRNAPDGVVADEED